MEGVGEAQGEAKSPKGERRLPHQAVLFLPGVLEGGRFRSERLPEGVEVALGGRALGDPEGEAGEGVFSLWPRTDGEGRLLRVQAATRLRQPYGGPEVAVQGILLYADRERLVLLVVPKEGEAFKVALRRDRGFAARLEPKRAYRVEGRLGGAHLLAERAWPLARFLEARKGGQALPPAIQGRENPYWVPAPGKGAEAPPPRGQRPSPPKEEGQKPPPRERGRPDPVRVWRAPEPPEDPAPPDLGRPPALGKGQVMGIAGTGPYYLVLLPQAVAEWWPRVERLLPEFPRRYEVRFYPDGSRAVVAGDLEALKVWYKRLFRG